MTSPPPATAAPPDPPLPSPFSASQVTAAYLLLAMGWIVASDLLLGRIPPSLASPALLEPLKGLGFVLLTALALFHVLRRNERYRQRMLEALARSERDYRLVFDANPNPMYFFDLDDLRLLAVNQAMLDQYGYSRQEALALSLADIRPAQALPHFYADLARARTHPHALWIGQYRHRRRDGSEFDAEITSHVTRFGDRPARLVMAVDISERVLAQRALQASEERYRELVELMPEAVLLLEEDRVFFANPAAATLFSLAEPVALIGRPLQALVAPPSWPARRARNRAVLDGDSSQQGFAPCVLRREDGSSVEAQCAAVPFAGAGRRALQLLLRDMTEWNAAQRALAEANRALGEASLRVIEAQERERRSLARELHDEIGQALSAMALRLRLLLAAHGIADDDPQAAPLNRMLADTLEQTRSLSLQLRPPQLDDFGLPSAMRALIQRLFADTGVHCELEIEGVRDGTPDRAAVTAYRIVQESLTNVLRHADARHVRVELLGDAQALRLKVIDDGRGFDAGAVAAGLGLPGIRERVALHGGTLALRSHAGLGTALEAVLPWDARA
jgi:PAS domain S-box-containing protein